jgi:adenylate cyclase
VAAAEVVAAVEGTEPGRPGIDVVGLLSDIGAGEEEIARAETEGTLPLLAVERILAAEEVRHDLEAVAERTGMSVEQITHIWRSLGFAQPRPGERAFTDTDLEILVRVGAMMADEVTSPDLVLQMSRVIGSSIARIASAHVDMMTGKFLLGEGVAGQTDEQTVVNLATVLPLMPQVLEATWRRHLHDATRRRMAMVLTGQEQAGVVGFADLVGFTALSQQVTERELAAIVEQFEELAFEVVTEGGGRVVKMIGDEVMFTVESPPAAAEMALALAEGTRDADVLSDVRVGLASGNVLEREGDLYGPTVNLASRITGIAFPGSIVVSRSMRDELHDVADYALRAMRPRYLKDIGRVPLYVLRRGVAAQSRFADRRQVLRDATKARVDAPTPAPPPAPATPVAPADTPPSAPAAATPPAPADTPSPAPLAAPADTPSPAPRAAPADSPPSAPHRTATH